VTRGDATTTQGKQEGGTMRDDMTTRLHIERQLHVKWLRHNEKPHKNQPGKWEATAR
jgi:hypothetical protein